MAVVPIDFLNFSTSILNNNSSEIIRRNAISRSYYAVYTNAINLKNKFGLPTYSDHRSHSALQTALKNHSDRRLKLLSARIKIAHSKRIICDYKLDENVTMSDARQSLVFNQKIFNDITSML
ncbi:hypothetical protein [Acidithiobacillus albertensis]|uniref:hypothetical protein n=1 Tax=Acidithiobacillus albertensis TaxID=119978 RepID=UPI00094ABEEF|nr:hypothetical protein [Acidithiobacillus albertensis]